MHGTKSKGYRIQVIEKFPIFELKTSSQVEELKVLPLDVHPGVFYFISCGVPME
jgi:hypothetical protein